MKIFSCQHCGQLISFENVQCLGCGHLLGYLPDGAVLSALEPAGQGLWRPLAPQSGGQLYRMCFNYSQEQVCNWMVPAEESGAFCRSCRLNQMIPDLSQPENRGRWYRLEVAKRYLIYSLLCLRLPLSTKQQDPQHGLAFAFLADPEPNFQETNKILTGHAQGLITINIAEADDAVREKMRLEMNEPYRTLLGHFRHEVGHYYWEQLVNRSQWLETFRALFGDERTDYDQALQNYYARGVAPDWQQYFVSAYASAHPWEDWAETWAHYLHMIDTLETAQAFGLTVGYPVPGAQPLSSQPLIIGCRPRSLEEMLDRWFPLTYALNSINRSMGLRDLYPFVLSRPAIEKLRFVYEVISWAGD